MQQLAPGVTGPPPRPQRVDVSTFGDTRKVYLPGVADEPGPELSRREVLEALRGRLVAELDAGHKPECVCECGPFGDARVLAALSKELRAVVAELEALPAPEGKTVSGDLRERVAGVLSGPA